MGALDAFLVGGEEDGVVAHHRAAAKASHPSQGTAHHAPSHDAHQCSAPPGKGRAASSANPAQSASDRHRHPNLHSSGHTAAETANASAANDHGANRASAPHPLHGARAAGAAAGAPCVFGERARRRLIGTLPDPPAPPPPT